MKMPVTAKGYVVASDGHKVFYDHYTNGHEKALIIAHGFFNSKQAVLLQELAVSLNDEYDVLVFDFRGHGQSRGWFHWTTKEYLDLLAVVEFAGAHYRKIGVIGFSLGAATSIIAASKTTRIDSIVAISAPTELGKIEYRFWKFDIKNDLLYTLFGRGRHGKGVRWGPFWQKKEKPIDLVKSIKTPVFYIHGDEDWVVDHWHSRRLYDQTTAVKRLSIIKKGPHAEYLLKDGRDQVQGMIREWFRETL